MSDPKDKSVGAMNGYPPSFQSGASCCGYDREELDDALGVQVGGGHYKTKAIQPVQYCMANNIGFMEGSVIKYVTRWRDKGGVEDLKKARHFLDMLIEAQ